MVSSEILGTNGMSSVGGELVSSLKNLENNSATSLENAFRSSSAFGNADYNFLSSSWVSEGKFGDFDGREDAQLTIKDTTDKLETFSLTGDGYGEVFKDKNSNFEQVIFRGIDATTSVQISAINDIKFGDYIGASFNVQTIGSITTSNIFSNNGAINLTSSQESVTTKGNITTSGTVNIQGDNVYVIASNIAAQNATLLANHNLNLEESQLHTTENLTLLAKDTVRVRDSVANPFLAQAGGKLNIQGNLGIDILALNHPETPFQSGGDLSLVSDGIISGDAHFTTGGNFSLLNLQGGVGKFLSLYDPIINSSGSVSIGDYAGEWLIVNAGGSITAGTINTSSLTNGSFIGLSAAGNITTGSLLSYGSTGSGANITLSSGGDINTTAGTLQSSGNHGGDITLTAKGNI